MSKFTEKFDQYVCVGDSIAVEIDGLTITARIEHDQDYKIDDDDAHDIDQAVTGCSDEDYLQLMETRKAWFNNEWFYCILFLSVSKCEVVLDNYASSLGGIECNYPNGNNDYLTEAANELLSEAVDAGKLVLKELAA